MITYTQLKNIRSPWKSLIFEPSTLSKDGIFPEHENSQYLNQYHLKQINHSHNMNIQKEKENRE